MNVQPTISQVIGQLERAPKVFQLLATDLSQAQAAAKPSPVSWSIVEIIAHLVHTELHCYQARLQHIRSGSTVIVPAYDAKRFESEGAYSGVALSAGLASFANLRAENTLELRHLDERDFALCATHESVGEFTLADLVYEWAAHDAGHMRQVAIVIRDVLCNPFIGPFRD